MHQVIIHEKFPVYILEVEKSDCRFSQLEDVVAHFVREAEAHPVVRLIGVFDHYAHTSAFADGENAPDIVGAVNVVVCFGMAIPQPEILALRLRSIGIADVGDRFTVSFLGTPMPIANTAMEIWARGLMTRTNPNDTASQGRMVTPSYFDYNNNN
ncbi:DUF6858 family protein [Breoghania sp.]|uniref:DUF6858 family protein n=1 Tax=Breoghania sp. TaxID=2065378 RepID=UPI0026158E01|nr:hypothetical protein [Breoghania sp.]MDJ0933692.1 hypothetical protein [Breoghania sp.]